MVRVRLLLHAPKCIERLCLIKRGGTVYVSDYVNDRGNRCKEDRIGFGKDFAYVMDGATGLTTGLIEDYLSDTVWFVENATTYLNHKLTENVAVDSTTLFQNLSKDMTAKLKAYIDIDSFEDAQLPSAALILLRKIGADLVIESYGDCTAVIEYSKGHYQVIHDGRATELDRGVINKMKERVMTDNLTMKEAKQSVHPLLINNRQLKNQPDGYAAMDITTNYINKGMKYVCHYQDVQAVWLFSDGVDSYYSDLNLATDAVDMVKQMKETSVHQVIDRLRITEESDEGCEMYPRMKPKDDASLVYVVCDK